MENQGLLGGNLSVSVQPVTVDTMTIVKLAAGIAVAGIAIIISWGVMKALTK